MGSRCRRFIFFFPEQSFLTKYDKSKEAKKKMNSRYIADVLDGLIFHPRTHLHIKSPIDKHEIRIGGGIDNPFLYLFHLRYQLCPIKEKRVAEKERLIALFETAVKNDKFGAANKLLAQP